MIQKPFPDFFVRIAFLMNPQTSVLFVIYSCSQDSKDEKITINC